VTSIIQPSIERTATAPVEVRASVVAGLELLLRGGEESMSISVDAMVVFVGQLGLRGLGSNFGILDVHDGFFSCR